MQTNYLTSIKDNIFTMLKLSIIVIGYTIEKYIGRCLDSILKQNLDECEIIFVDDGSTDFTANEVKKRFKNYTFCHYIFKENGGANSARKTGFEKANGQYVAFVDGDDWVESCYVDTIKKEIDTQFDILAFEYQYVWDNNYIEKNFKENEVFNCDNYEYLEAVLETKFSHVFWDKVYKKEFLNNIDFQNTPNITMGDDLAAQVLLGLGKPKVKGIHKILYNYYLRNSSASKKFSEKTIEIKIALDYIEQKLAEKKLETKFRDQIEYHYFRTFLFYVVRNRFPGHFVQKQLYDLYKSRKINISKNKYIKKYMYKKNGEKILYILYIFNYQIGCMAALIFLKLQRKR